MIGLLCSLALALSPEELSAAMPAAQEVVAQCETTGCSREAGAQAAFVLAVGTYVTDGRADGDLAATVRLLDGDLFAALPDVVQAAATTPQEWAERVGGTAALSREEAARRRLEAVQEKMDAAVNRGKYPGTDVTVRVVDTNGAVVPRAFVRFPLEDDRHETNTEYGTWTGEILYPRDGNEVFFEKGDTLRFEVFAPGFATRQVVYMVPRKRKNVVEVVLEPGTFAPPAPDAPSVAKRAHQAYAAWVEADAAYVKKPTDDNRDSASSHARTAVDASRAWLDATQDEDALHMCRMVGSIGQCGAL